MKHPITPDTPVPYIAENIQGSTVLVKSLPADLNGGGVITISTVIIKDFDSKLVNTNHTFGPLIPEAWSRVSDIIKPCPFCGWVKPRITFLPKEGDEIPRDTWILECLSPHCLDSSIVSAAHGDSPAEAVARWNHRAPVALSADDKWLKVDFELTTGDPLSTEEVAKFCGFGEPDSVEVAAYWQHDYKVTAFFRNIKKEETA